MKRLVVFCEGQGDEEGALLLVKRLLVPLNPWDSLTLDEAPFRAGEAPSLFKNDFEKWSKLLNAAAKRPNLGGVIAIFDGDCEKINREPFCAKAHAAQLVSAAKSHGAGTLFSLAIVFARQEFESWLIAGVESLAGKPLPPDNRPGVNSETKTPQGDLDMNPRGAKEWLSKIMREGYSPTRDQCTLTKLVDLELIRSKNMRSFTRLQSAVNQIVTAIQDNKHIATPA